jgi:hypothetical protein
MMMEIIYKSYLQNILSHIADTMLQEILKDSKIGETTVTMYIYVERWIDVCITRYKDG